MRLFPKKRRCTLGYLYVPGVQLTASLVRASLLNRMYDKASALLPTIVHDLGRLTFCEAVNEPGGVTFYYLTLTSRAELYLSQYEAAMTRVLTEAYAQCGPAAFLPSAPAYPMTSLQSVSLPTPRLVRGSAILPWVALELPPTCENEFSRLKHLAEVVADQYVNTDIRDLRPRVQAVLGDGYYVGAGSNHLWVHRRDNGVLGFAADRLAIVYNLQDFDMKHHVCYYETTPWAWSSLTYGSALHQPELSNSLQLMLGCFIQL